MPAAAAAAVIIASPLSAPLAGIAEDVAWHPLAVSGPLSSSSDQAQAQAQAPPLSGGHQDQVRFQYSYMDESPTTADVIRANASRARDLSL
jgi:hypothetical protein